MSQPDSATTQVNEVAAQPAAEEEEDQNEDQDVPDLTNFTIEELKQRYDSVIIDYTLVFSVTLVE